MDKMTNQIRAVLRRIGAISEDEYRCVRIETGSPDPEHRSLAKDLAIAVLDRAFVKVDTRLVELSVFIMPGPFYSTFYFEIGLCTNIKGRAFSVVEDLNIDTDPQHPEVMLCIPDMVAAKLRKIDIYKANEPAPRRGK